MHPYRPFMRKLVMVSRQFLTDEESEQAIKNAEAYSGFTMEELQEQAEKHRFETTGARLSWMVMSSMQKKYPSPGKNL